VWKLSHIELDQENATSLQHVPASLVVENSLRSALHAAHRRARFRPEHQPLGFTRAPLAHLTGTEAGKTFLDGGPDMWLRVGPQKPLEKLMKVTDLETTLQGIAVVPLYEASEPPSSVWNSDGAGWVRAIGEHSPSTAFMFADGEIWVINTLFFKFYPHLILSDTS
jgi:hypothetical protein